MRRAWHLAWKLANIGAEEFQTSFRETGILALALKGLDSNTAQKSLRKQYLRLVGNCVADNGISPMRSSIGHND
jgi:hypothetical protein